MARPGMTGLICTSAVAPFSFALKRERFYRESHHVGHRRAAPHVFDDSLAKRNAVVLAVAQAWPAATTPSSFPPRASSRAVLAPDKGLATLPITGMVLGMWIGTLPIGWLARHFGRRFALQTGSLFGIASGLISYSAVMSGSFLDPAARHLLRGLYAAAHQSYPLRRRRHRERSVPPQGRVLGAGRRRVRRADRAATRDLPPRHAVAASVAASFLGQSACAVIAAIVLMFVKVPPLPAVAQAQGRSLGEIVLVPRFMVAVALWRRQLRLGEMVMTSTPLAMVGLRHSVTDATLASSGTSGDVCAEVFFTGSLIARFGLPHHRRRPRIDRRRSMVGIAGTSVAHFWSDCLLVLAGISPSSRHHHGDALPPRKERNKVQAFNDS